MESSMLTKIQDISGGKGARSSGFGLFEGVWQHTGWATLEKVQNSLKKMVFISLRLLFFILSLIIVKIIRKRIMMKVMLIITRPI